MKNAVIVLTTILLPFFAHAKGLRYYFGNDQRLVKIEGTQGAPPAFNFKRAYFDNQNVLPVGFPYKNRATIAPSVDGIDISNTVMIADAMTIGPADWISVAGHWEVTKVLQAGLALNLRYMLDSGDVFEFSESPFKLVAPQYYSEKHRLVYRAIFAGPLRGEINVVALASGGRTVNSHPNEYACGPTDLPITDDFDFKVVVPSEVKNVPFRDGPVQFQYEGDRTAYQKKLDLAAVDASTNPKTSFQAKIALEKPCPFSDSERIRDFGPRADERLRK